jgi:hypothetical protein
MKTFFLDFEASSLDDDSYPIEVAWVSETGQGESYLIRPEPTWTDWSPKSETFHHISRATLLREGIPAVQVARRALAVLEGHLAVSDNPAHDGYWLSMLYKLIGYPEVRLHSIHFLMGRELPRMLTLIRAEPESGQYYREARHLLDEGQILIANAMETANLQTRHRHRALSDATELWLIWKTVQESFARRLRG